MAAIATKEAELAATRAVLRQQPPPALRDPDPLAVWSGKRILVVSDHARGREKADELRVFGKLLGMTVRVVRDIDRALPKGAWDAVIVDSSGVSHSIQERIQSWGVHVLWVSSLRLADLRQALEDVARQNLEDADQAARL